MSRKPPPGLAMFDSAAAMLQATARYHDGRDFAAFAQPALYRQLVRRSGWVPRQARQALFARAGAGEGVRPENIDRVDTDAVADWAAGLYPQRRYPVAVIGSSSGALVHLAAALGAPWLPQTFLTLLRQRVDPDDPVQAMEIGMEPGRKLLSANPGVQLHHMHDPSQDRLMLPRVSYFRWKYRRLPRAYRDFLTRSLEPGGTLIVAEGERSWPVTRVGERHVFQMGAQGGPTVAEYMHGGSRVAEHLARHGADRQAWEPPAPDEDAPEAEWGFEPALREELAELARERGWRILRLRFHEPQDLSPAVADLYRAWNSERGIPFARLLVESFILHDPYWAVRTGSMPFWMRFNMQPSLDSVESYVSRSGPFDDILLMLFAHGVDSIGLPSIEAWRALLARAGRTGAFLGVDEDAYPAHFSAFARYDDGLRRLTPHYDLPPPIPLDRAAPFLHADSNSVRLETL